MPKRSPHSLRDLYTAPSNSWNFASTAPGNSTSSSSNLNIPDPASASGSYQWSTRTAQSPLLNLSSINDDDSPLDVKELVQGLLASALLQYAATAIAIPWDVAKTLLQVQWVPREAGELPLGAVLITDQEDDEEGELSDSSVADDSYFADPTNPDATPPPRRLSDDKGYIVRQSVLEEGTIPEYVIPVGSADGTWGMMKRLGRFKPEGWLALWKGLLTSAVSESLAITIHPIIYSILESIVPVSPFGPSPLLLPVTPQVLTGFILSPLDLVRTRLIVQSSHPRYRTYSGPIDALKQIISEEGGIKGIYLHPHLLIPTLLDCTLRSLVPLVLPGLVASYLSFGNVPTTAETYPFMWAVSEFLGSCAGLLVTLPFETVRRRLQVQTRGTAKPLKACVELRPAPYNGIVDAFWHILTEERSDLPLKPKRRRRKSTSAAAKGKGVEGREEAVESREEEETWLRNTGLGQLYRGLGMRVGASAIVFALVLFNGRVETDAGWAEL
ncbi:mitochondrial carrier [Panus rudis PR-1116 ss-1]|nr:mitochondrial carrier [Panus rudis PR-1116 ss-1]